MEEIKITGEPSASGDRCKFTVDRPLAPGESAFFANVENAGLSPLARDLLALPGVESVLIADNTVTVGSAHPVDWPRWGSATSSASTSAEDSRSSPRSTSRVSPRRGI